MKEQTFRVGLCSLAIATLTLFSLAPSVFAERGSNDSPDDDSVTTTQVKQETETENETEHAEDVKIDDSKVQARMAKIRTEGRATLAERKEKRETKTAAQRQKICENRKNSITNKVTAYNKAAQTKLDRFNVIFERVKAFKADKALEVADYETLVTTATEKQTAATEAVAALKTITADFDCRASDPATTVANIKAAAVDTRTALKDYRKSIKDIVVALAQVNKADDTSESSTEAN